MPELMVPAAQPIDRYEVLEFLAEGGMGAIYLGKKLGAGGFEKEIVLKQLRPEYTEQPEFIELFLREAKLSATLDHANIVHTIDLVHAGHDYFMVMEYVRGGDLRILLKRAKKRKRRMLPAAALYIAREVLVALVYAHGKKGRDGQSLGLIHRDVSPSNILLSGAGEVKLSDFGIAKATTFRSAFFRVRGKVGYMSPEQAKSEPLLPRSDIYSVAVILYEMLTGEKLHVAASLTTSADEIYAAPVPAVSSKTPGLPSDLDGVLWKALAVNPDARYQTASDMLEALRQIVSLAGLSFDGQQLAQHLVDICGPVEEWGSSVVREPTALETVGAATAGLPPERDGEGEEEGSAESRSDLVWLDHDQAIPRFRAPPLEAARIHAGELRPVEEFIADHVSAVEPSLARPRRRVGPIVLVGGTLLVVAAAAFALGAGREEAPPAPPPAAPVAPPPPPAAKPGKVSVESDPSRARVLVDGQTRCVTPCTFNAPASAPRRVTIEKGGYLPWSVLVVPGSNDAALRARLRREPPASWGRVVLRGAAPANVLVDGKAVGYATPDETPLPLPPGEQRLSLAPPGGEAPARELRVVVKSGETTQVDVPAP